MPHHQAVLSVGDEDPVVTGYRWRLSASHPVADICDYYATLDLGMGAGVFPRDQVPRGKAHPHCMCSLTPTTRRMRKDGVRGSVDVAEFLGRVSPEQRAALVPRWAQDLNALGMPWQQLQHPQGQWLMSMADARQAMGAERFDAAQAVGRAARTADWPTVRLSRRAAAAHLELARSLPDDAAAQAVARAITAGGPVPSREAHYLKRRVMDGEALADAEALDRFMAAPLLDPAARVYRQVSGQLVRYAVYQAAARRVAVVDATGRRITAYTLDQHTPPDTLGDFRWTLATLISP